MRAYAETYLRDGRRKLGWMFHHGIVNRGIDPDDLSRMFSGSEIGRLFGNGDPSVIAGMSGVEIAEELLKAYGVVPCDRPMERPELWVSDVYWAGWAVAYHQWYTGRPFRRIFGKVPFGKIIGMYHPFHEMDITSFVSEMEMRIGERPAQSKLRTLREGMGWSQSELAEVSTVDVASIQLYEQDPEMIDDAPVKTVYRLATALSCSVEELLKDPTIR